MNQLRENEQWIFRDIYTCPVFKQVYRADLELLENVGQRMIHHFFTGIELYELTVYERSESYPLGHINLTARTKNSKFDRMIYQGPLTAESWQQLQNILYDNFVDTLQFG